jgi:hypothetical protein
MRKHNPKNERIKRRYFDYLREAKRMDTSSIDMAAAAITSFEHWANYRDFAKFHIEQAKGFKAHLAKAVNEKTGKPLAKATIHSRLMALKAFIFWLAGQSGYKSRISYADADYFNPSANDSRIATARREKKVPTVDQIKLVLSKMPTGNDIEKRDRAIVAFAELLEGWWTEAKARGLVEKTRSEYTRTLKRLEEHLGHDDAGPLRSRRPSHGDHSRYGGRRAPPCATAARPLRLLRTRWIPCRWRHREVASGPQCR